MPSSVPRGVIGDHTTLRGNEFTTNATTDATGLITGTSILCAGTTIDVTASGLSAIGQLYSTYRYMPGTTFHWVPQVSMSTAGVVYVGFTDNVEIIANYAAAGTLAAKLVIVKSLANLRSYPVWQQWNFSLPPKLRRKRFDVNNNFTVSNADELDRSVQGAWLFGVEGTTASAQIARPYRSVILDVEGLKATAT
jgi:hypothetical protein